MQACENRFYTQNKVLLQKKAFRTTPNPLASPTFGSLEGGEFKRK